jgi:hypothetical protein
VRYITVSGLQIGVCSQLTNIDTLIDGLVAQYGKPKSQIIFGQSISQFEKRGVNDLIKNGVPEQQRSEALHVTPAPRQAASPRSRAADWHCFKPHRDCAPGPSTVKAGEGDGIGFVLTETDFVAIDLDHCRDPTTGKVDDWAQAIVEQAAGAYCETTVFGGRWENARE